MGDALRDRVVLVTGGSRGIGAEVAVKAAAEGATVAVHYRTAPEAAQRTLARIGEARAGDTVVCPPGEEHWHGATADTFMSHFAFLEANPDGSDPTTWLEPLSDEQYAAAQQH